MLGPDQYQRLYNVDNHLREVAAKKRSDDRVVKAVLSAYPEAGSHLLSKLEGYDYCLAEWLLHLDPDHRVTFWTHDAFKL